MHDEMPATWRDLVLGGPGLPLAVICLGIALHAINVPLTATVLPTAVREIGGLDFLAWATTVYLVASILTSVSGARLRRRLGNRGGYYAAAALFALGSLVCALAPAMPVLLAGRFVQGAGGGLILALGYSLLRSVIPGALWAKAFAVVSAIWGVCAVLGAFIGGLFTDLLSWRGAYLVMLPLALLLVLLARAGLPPRSAGGAPAGPYPLGRLLLIGAAILAVASSGNVPGAGWRLALILAALPPILMALRLDRRAAHNRLFPRDAFSLRGPVGNGLWLVFLMMVGLYAFSVYGPVLLQTLHDVPATVAGAFVAWVSLAWTIGALLTDRVPPASEHLAIVASPALMTVGLLGLAVAMPEGPLWLIPPLVFCLGGGIGIGWAFINKGIMSGAGDRDGEVAATAIPTTQMFGFAFGAAIAGLVANAAGFAEGLSRATAEAVAVSLYLGFALAPALGVVAALRMVNNGARHRY